MSFKLKTYTEVLGFDSNLKVKKIEFDGFINPRTAAKEAVYKGLNPEKQMTIKHDVRVETKLTTKWNVNLSLDKFDPVN